jgi:hypothetical protein
VNVLSDEDEMERKKVNLVQERALRFTGMLKPQEVEN